MPITLIRVVNQQTIRRSILLDKLDDGQANVEGYAHKPRQKVYVPYSNPIDPAVKGYLDFVPSDRVLLSADRGTIHGLAAAGKILTFAFSSALIATPVVSAANNAAGVTRVIGTTFLSVPPDVTYVTLYNLVGATQTIPSSDFSLHVATEIRFIDAKVTIGVPGVGWKVSVQANSKLSNVFTL